MSQLNARVKWDGEDFVCRLNEGELSRVPKALGWGKSVYAAINGFWAGLAAAYKEIENKGCGSYSYPQYVQYTYDESSMYMLYVELVKFGGMPKVGSITGEQCLKYATGQTTPRSGTLDKIREAISNANGQMVDAARQSQLAKDYHYNYEINWNKCDRPQSSQPSAPAPRPAASAPSVPTSFPSGNRKGGDTFFFDGTVPFIQMYNEACICLNLYIVPVPAARDMNASLPMTLMEIQRREGIEGDFTGAKLNAKGSIKDALDQLAATFYMTFFVMTRDSAGSLVEIEDYSLPLNHLVAPKASSVQNVANDLVNKSKSIFKSLFGKK